MSSKSLNSFFHDTLTPQLQQNHISDDVFVWFKSALFSPYRLFLLTMLLARQDSGKTCRFLIIFSFPIGKRGEGTAACQRAEVLKNLFGLIDSQPNDPRFLFSTNFTFCYNL